MSDIKSPFDFKTPNGFMIELLTKVHPDTEKTKSGNLIVSNPLSDGSVELPEYAVAVYNVVMGSQLLM